MIFCNRNADTNKYIHVLCFLEKNICLSTKNKNMYGEKSRDYKFRFKSSTIRYISHFNTLGRPKQNRHFASDSTCIFVNRKSSIFIGISQKFTPDCPVDNNSTLDHIMVWRKTGGKPLPLDPFYWPIYESLGFPCVNGNCIGTHFDPNWTRTYEFWESVQARLINDIK